MKTSVAGHSQARRLLAASIATLVVLLVPCITASLAIAASNPAGDSTGRPSAKAPANAPIKPLGIDLAHYDYPFAVSHFVMHTPRGSTQMAYMDIAAAGGAPDAPVIVLLHGKNFSGAYWGATAQWLSDLGYRVVVPDQIGFGKSDKPAAYSYTFAQLAANTHALLRDLHIDQATILGHSMGGMLAVRYALMYPQATQQLILVDPIGLEDWKAKGVPYRGMDAWYAREMKKNYASLKAYEQKSYYHGTWAPQYAPPAQMIAGMYASPDKARLAWVQALLYDTIYNEPVVYEFGDLKPDTTLMVGSLDRTALGKDLVSPALRAQLGRYPALARTAVAAMPHGHLVIFKGLGHLPFVEAPERFQKALTIALDNRPHGHSQSPAQSQTPPQAESP